MRVRAVSILLLIAILGTSSFIANPWVFYPVCSPTLTILWNHCRLLTVLLVVYILCSSQGVYDDIIVALVNSEAVLLVLLDLSTVFDTIDHTLLLSTLSKLQIEGTVHKWIKSYLTHMIRHVSISSECSDGKQLTCVVPQGSVLDPHFVYHIYIYTSSLGTLLRKQILFDIQPILCRGDIVESS